MSTSLAGTKLDRLNSLLKKENLAIPDFRRNVSLSGANLKWLRRAIAGRPEASAEVKDLVELELVQLLKPLH